MSFWEDRVLPHVTEIVLGRGPASTLRKRGVEDAVGDVLELGYGSGTTLPFYPDAVRSVLAVEPCAVARRLARRREAASALDVVHVGLDGQALPLADSSIDTVVTTFTLCTIPDHLRALNEARRVLRPDGRLLFVEHGRHPRPHIARRQRYLDPLQRRVFGGCRLVRKIDDDIRSGGFDIDSLEMARLPAPGGIFPVYIGRASPRVDQDRSTHERGRAEP